MNLIPETLERDYMRLKWRLFSDLAELVEQVLSTAIKRREDAGEDLMMLLGLTPEQLLDRGRIVERLVQLANDINQEKITQIGKLLGRPVSGVPPERIALWADAQADVIMNEVRVFLGKVGAEAATQLGKASSFAATVKLVKILASDASKVAEVRGSAAVLQLNSEIIQEVAQSGGSVFYTWQTEEDSRVRPHHADLNKTVQTWNNPPRGGGTNSGDVGHPGSGYGCRCVPLPLSSEAVPGAALER